jgi:hypothetical protein
MNTIIEITVKIVWNYPSDGQLPTERAKYYIVDENNQHRIMTHHPNGGYGDMNWESEDGSQHSWKSNEQIKKWTNLLPN